MVAVLEALSAGSTRPTRRVHLGQAPDDRAASFRVQRAEVDDVRELVADVVAANGTLFPGGRSLISDPLTATLRPTVCAATKWSVNSGNSRLAGPGAWGFASRRRLPGGDYLVAPTYAKAERIRASPVSTSGRRCCWK